MNQRYLVRSSVDEREVPVRGTSLNALLGAAGERSSGRAIEVSDGTRTVALTPDQLSGAGAGSPVIYEDGGRAVFLRPSVSPDDLNGDQALSAASLTVRVLERETLKVEGKVTDAAVRVGQRVSFTASARGGAGGQPAYRWTFGDGSRRRSGARVTHAFGEEGSYNVLVGATTAGDRTGATAVIRVRVGPPAKGPDRQGGGTDAQSSAPSSGTAAGSGSGTSGGTGDAARGPARAPRAAAPSRRTQPAPTPGGRQIEGRLLADATVVPSRPAARKRAARTGNDREGEQGGFAVPGAAVGVLATLGLVGAGVLMELRPAVPWPRRRAA